MYPGGRSIPARAASAGKGSGMRQRLAIVLITLGCVLVTGIGSAAASVVPLPNATVAKVKGLAGYHFRVGTTIKRLTMRGRVTVPNSTCGTTRHYGLQIGAGYRLGGVAGQPVSAIVLILLKCTASGQSGTAQIVAGYNAKDPTIKIHPGDVIKVWVSVTASKAIAVITYPDGRSRSLSALGGKPTGGDYALTLPVWNPPHYTPAAFAGCFVKRKQLSAFHPNIWESITGGGTVDGHVSTLTNGTAFTITY
jgi:hypothetical protein